jgi:type VI secretion system protein ImpA
MIELDLLVKPVSGESPCGPDLDLDGDADYLNFFAAAEPLLPKSYFEVTDAEGNKKRFDPNSINFGGELEKAKPLLARTRDLRLVVFLAKIAILARDLTSFARCLEAIAVLLDQHWTEVHPRLEDGELSQRLYTIEALDVVPTVIMPLQFQPLLNNRRYGAISYRTCLIAKGEVLPREDDLVIDRAMIDQVFDGADFDQLKATTTDIVALSGILARIEKTWSEKSGSATVINLERLRSVTDGMSITLGEAVRRRDPAAAAIALPEPEVVEGASAQAIAASHPGHRVASMAEVAAALDGVARYFRKFEPSSPALLLVLQAQQMLGKSFVEALRILVPSHTEAAAINIGRDRFFDLPIERMAGLLGQAPPAETISATETSAVAVTQRGQALGLLEQEGAYYRATEPSSPVPYLTDRARELAQRDFLSLLRDVLPEGALRTLDNQG